MTNDFCYRGEEDQEPYHYTECGLDDVYLRGGVLRTETNYGTAVSIKNDQELHKAIGTFLVTRKKILSGKELRFLRKEMDLTQAELGRVVGLSDQQVARWEKGQYQIPSAADYLLRVLYIQHIGRKVDVLMFVRALEGSDDLAQGKQEFVTSGEGWKAAA